MPVYFIMGRHDRICHPSQLEHYAAQLKAPKVGLIVFEHSDHLASFEEPEKFNEFMTHAVKKH